MRISHRLVEKRDIQTICNFFQNEDELFFLSPEATFPLTPLQLQKQIEQRSDSTVVLLCGEIVAFANFYRWETGGRCSIGNVIVAPAVRVQGVARYLIEQMTNLAFSKYRAAEVTLSCFNQNIAGLLLYAKLGFQPYEIEERQGRQGNRVALIHMKRLRDSIQV